MTNNNRCKQINNNKLFLASIVDSSDDAIIGKTLEGTILTWNLGACNIYGYMGDEVIGRPISILAPPDRPDEISQLLKKIKMGQRIDHYETVRMRKDGKRINVSLTISPIIDDDGNIIGASTIARDITDRKATEKKLHESEKRFRSIFELSTDLICIADINGYFRLINPAFVKILGYSINDLLGRPFLEFVHRDDKQKTINAIEKLQSGQTVIAFENRYIRKDGGIVWLEWNSQPISDNKTIAIARDITERKKIIAELERSNKDLEQFAYIISHDLQGPLQTMSSFAELLIRYKIDKDSADFIDYINSASKRLQQMIIDLLKLSRVGTKKIEAKTDVRNVIEQAMINLHDLIDKNHAQIEVGDMPIVYANASLLIQLFQNLIENAIKFRRSETPRIFIKSKNTDNVWIFSIQDNGIGIDEKYLKKLFVPFQRLNEDYPGTGIGLAICKKIVDLHGGKIWIESELGKGSIFYFDLSKKYIDQRS